MRDVIRRARCHLPIAIRIGLLAAILSLTPGTVHAQSAPAGGPAAAGVSSARGAVAEDARLAADLEAIRQYRPGYAFWRHIFSIPDGSVAYGSAADGRLLAVFPAAGNWASAARWEEPTLAELVVGRPLPSRLADRRDEVARLLEVGAGPILHNPTRGRFLQPNAARYGVFLDEWAAIYERFGVPAEVGLAQAIVESGLSGTVRSEARAVGFCQWLIGNWDKLNRLTPHVIEWQNQTTQAPFCAAYLTVLATRYGSFIPALSEHHAGGTNVGRTLINGERLGGTGIAAQYFLGSELALALRQLGGGHYAPLYRTYGPRSYRYSELFFGNLETVREIRAAMPQRPIHAMRTSRPVTLDEVTRRTGLSAAEVRRYNPALQRQVPARATLFLPVRVPEFGTDVAFWRRPANAGFNDVLSDFLALQAPAHAWDEAAFEPRLREFQRRFERTGSEEGTVMAVILAYFIEDARTGRRGAILDEFRRSAGVERLFEDGVRATGLGATAAARE
jgi:hypothetical protein